MAVSWGDMLHKGLFIYDLYFSSSTMCSFHISPHLLEMKKEKMKKATTTIDSTVMQFHYFIRKI